MFQVLEEGTPCSVTLLLVLMRLTLLGELDKTDGVAHKQPISKETHILPIWDVGSHSYTDT